MSAEAIAAACAAAIALLALVVSIEQMRIMRGHNRKSVRPILRFSSGYVGPSIVGLRLQNSGLGPAIVVRSEIWLDGESLGSFSRQAVAQLQEAMRLVKLQTATIQEGSVLEQGFAENLLSMDEFEWGRSKDMSFFALVHGRIRLDIVYESVYGGEDFLAHFEDDASDLSLD